MKSIVGDEDKLNNSASILSESILFMIFLIFFTEIILSLIQKLQKRLPIKYHLIFRVLQPTVITTFIGLLAGLVLLHMNYKGALQEIKKSFADVFLIILLPPIIFESAINMKQKAFFSNFGTILLLAVFSTIFSTFIIGGFLYLIQLDLNLTLMNCLSYGAIISATDPVAVFSIFKELKVKKSVYILLYGESILNDAISLILYDTTIKTSNGTTEQQLTNSIDHFLATMVVSVLLGVAIGGLSSVILKYNQRDQLNLQRKQSSLDLSPNIPQAQQPTNQDLSLNLSIQEMEEVQDNIGFQIGKENMQQQLKILDKRFRQREIIIMFLMPWLAYLMGEFFQYSGIVTIMFSGIFMARYSVPNLSHSGKQLIKSIYQTIAYFCENLVFLFIGISYFGFNLNYSQVGIWHSLQVLVLILVSRVVSIMIIFLLANQLRTKKVPLKAQIAICFCGFRGAMAFALSLQAVHHFKSTLFLTITVLFISFNIFIQGPFLKSIVKWSDILDDKTNIVKKKYKSEGSPNKKKTKIFSNLQKTFLKLDNHIMNNILVESVSYNEKMIKKEQGRQIKSDSVINKQSDQLEMSCKEQNLFKIDQDE